MKITIDHATKEWKEGGLFSKKTRTSYNVHCHITFTEQEKETIKKFDLADAVVFEQMIDIGAGDGPQPYYTRISHLLKEKWERGFSTPSLAREWEDELKTKVLPNLKGYLDANQAPVAKSQTFEL